MACRTPHGVRGLKCLPRRHKPHPCWSHPSRGAWIEIPPDAGDDGAEPSHPSRGAWIEIAGRSSGTGGLRSRTPHGVRGLKFLRLVGGGL